MNHRIILTIFSAFLVVGVCSFAQAERLKDEQISVILSKLNAQNTERGQLFDEGNYAMFIHWGIYSLLGNEVDGKTYYGIGEWIMNKNMAGIPIARYKQLAGRFKPVNFDAKAIAQLAKDAGMKYIVITSKHHDGFAMYHSKACEFNIVDATPWQKDPMKELSAACRELGLGFGFYYSHNQDWTFPGGGNGPGKDEQGNRATFEDYFVKKCLPQVKEITTEYGPIELVWFDTPGRIPKKYVEQLVDVVHKNQPHALVSGRAGHGLGDYQTLGDMEVPHRNVEGMWESVDTTNDSWAYAWYDENWKTPKEILERLIACVARGGTYMLNIGPQGDGSVPVRTIETLTKAGAWIRSYPQVVYAADASPWQHALPWGDVTRRGNSLFLCVFHWPTSGKIYLPNLMSKITSAKLLGDGRDESVPWTKVGDWAIFEVPFRAPESLVSVIQLDLESEPEVDTTLALDPQIRTELLAEFAIANNAKKSKKKWTEKFGEWKSITHIHDFEKDGKSTWKIDVLEPGDYKVDLNYTGNGRLVWQVSIEGGQHIQNQQNSSHNYQEYPIGWIRFPKPGRYNVSVMCIDGNVESASLKSIVFTPIEY